MKKDYTFKLEFGVRDYECDLAGMVNNASYLNYLEHTRHEFVKTKGIDFAALAKDGIYLVVVRIEINYRYPLRSGDRFIVGLNTKRISYLRVGLYQDIYRLPDHRPVVNALVIVTALDDHGRPLHPNEIETLFAEILPKATS